ncbi:ATP-binding protein [Tessaracoccus sp. MC1679]|uniref:ATP-binding protein n=1 Tax=unclassified Tessaracoccus TaxID=2635419 RepID=UPI0015FF91E1|nr:ATP-binding protein [Tessaracoccus sp. MC1627]MBB1517281.1 ATP-binding protein [Tessaracoccus sp. MC1679]
MSRYLPRLADGELAAQLDAMGAVLIEGVKGCGKTASARQRAASEVLLDTDPEAERRAALDPRLLLDGATPKLLDEWQRAPRIWDAVRREVDARGIPGQFILTGSATPNNNLQRHTGAGRFGVMRMRTMTLTEKQASNPAVSLAGLLRGDPVTPANSTLGVRDYLHHIAVGGWPFLVGADERRARTFLDGYLDIIVEHDIDEVSGGPRNPRLVRRFLHAYAQMTAHPATLSAILKRMEDREAPSRPASQLYYDALTRMLIVDEVPAWDPAVRSSKRLVNTPKRLLADPSLSAGLLRLSTDGMLADLSTTGFLFESLVAHDLRVYSEAAGASVFHYREGEGRLEVDYVVEDRDGEWLAVEVKMGDAQVERAAGSLHALAARVERPPRALVVMTTGSLAYTREDGVHVVPLGALGP